MTISSPKTNFEKYMFPVQSVSNIHFQYLLTSDLYAGERSPKSRLEIKSSNRDHLVANFKVFLCLSCYNFEGLMLLFLLKIELRNM